MGLRKLQEQKWNHRTPPEKYPQTPGMNILYLAPSGQGKTHLMVQLLTQVYHRVFDRLVVCSPSVDIDSAWWPVKEMAKGFKESWFLSEWDPIKLETILEEQKARVKRHKDAKSTKPIEQLCVLVDDFADSPHVVHGASGILVTLFTRGRHLSTSAWVSSQKLRALSTVIRYNIRYMCVWRLRSALEQQALYEELSALFDVRTLHEMHERALNDAEHSFWYLNLIAKKRSEISHIRFDHRMVLDEGLPDPQDVRPQPAEQQLVDPSGLGGSLESVEAQVPINSRKRRRPGA